MADLLRHPSPLIPAMASGCLAALAHFESVAWTLVEHGTLSRLVTALNDTSLHELTHLNAAATIFELSRHAPLRLQVLSCRVVRALVRNLRVGPNEVTDVRARMQEKALGTLRELAQDERIRKSMAGNRTVTRVLFLHLSVGTTLSKDHAAVTLFWLVDHFTDSVRWKAIEACLETIPKEIECDWTTRIACVRMVPRLLKSDADICYFLSSTNRPAVASGMDSLIDMIHSKQGLALVEPILWTILFLLQVALAVDMIFHSKRTMKLLRYHMMSGVVKNVAPKVGELAYAILRITVIYHRKAICDSFNDSEVDHLYQEPPAWFQTMLDDIIAKRKEEDYLQLDKIADTFDKNDLAMLKKQFKHFDEDGSGSIDGDELINLMEAVGELPYGHLTSNIVRKHRLDQFMADADVDGDGTLDINEFLMMFSRLREEGRERERKIEEKERAKKAHLKNAGLKVKSMMRSRKEKQREEEEQIERGRLMEEEKLLAQEMAESDMLEREDRKWNKVRKLSRRRERQAGLQRQLREVAEKEDEEFAAMQKCGKDPLADLRERLHGKRE